MTSSNPSPAELSPCSAESGRNKREHRLANSTPWRDSRIARHLPLQLALLSVLLMAVLSSGCTVVPNSYYAADLPVQFVAPQNVNTRTIDFSKLSGTPVNTEMIGPGDQLEVSISAGLATEQPLIFPVRVAKNGYGNVDTLGPIRLTGLELDEAEVLIRTEGIRLQLYVNPRVTVSMKQKKLYQIMVVGAVEEPGQKLIPASQANLLNAIFAAGGLTEEAGSTVEITNLLDHSPTADAIALEQGAGITPAGYTSRTLKSAQVDLVKATQAGTNAYYIGDGGVVHVEQLDPKEVIVTGLVRKPGPIEFPVNQDLHLIDAIARAGHTTNQVADKVYVFRKMPGQAERVRIQCSLSKLRRDPTDNLRLAPGDTVYVEQTPATVLLDALQIIRIGVTSSFNPLL
jgi:polysaccharide biosynthesis/export protein